MASTEDKLLYTPGKAVTALGPIPFSRLRDTLTSFYEGRPFDPETSAGEIAIAMGAGAEVLPILQAGGAFTQLGVASPWSYDEICSSLTVRQREELDRQGHTQLRATYAPDSLGIQDLGKPEGLGPNELIHIISPDFIRKLEFVHGKTGGFRFQYGKEVVAPYTSEYFFFQGKLESAITGLTNLVEREMFRRRVARRSAFTVPQVSAKTIVRSILLEGMANA